MKKLFAAIMIFVLMVTFAGCCGSGEPEDVKAGKLDISSSSSKDEKATEKSTQKATEKATQKATEKATEKATQKATEKSNKNNASSNTSSQNDSQDNNQNNSEQQNNQYYYVDDPVVENNQPQQQQPQQQPQQQQPQQQPQQNTSSNIQMGTFTNNDIAFKYNNAYIKPNDTMASVIQKIGNANSKVTAPSCIGVGNDVIYYYNGFEIETYPSSSGEKVLHVYINDASIATEKGVKVGMKTQDIINAYGSNCVADDYSYSYKASGNMHLDFIIDNGVIIEIDYIYDVQ